MSGAVLRATQPSFHTASQRTAAPRTLSSRPTSLRFQRRRVCIARAAAEENQQAAEKNRYAPVVVDEEQLEVELANRDTPMIIDFYATWCGPCVMLAKELEQVASDLKEKVRILKVDVDQNKQISSDLQIQGLPTMIFIGTNKTKPALRMEGYAPAATIKEILEKEL